MHTSIHIILVAITPNVYNNQRHDILSLLLMAVVDLFILFHCSRCIQILFWALSTIYSLDKKKTVCVRVCVRHNAEIQKNQTLLNVA